MANVVMKSKDTLSAKLAECYVKINGRRYNFMQAINVEATFEKNKTEVPILGRTGTGNRSTGWSGTGSCTAHYNTSIIREMMYEYKETGEDTYFEMEISNYDPTSAAGKQTISLLDCNIDGGVLAKFDADGEYLDEDFDFTFDDFEMPQKFDLLPGMLSAHD